MLVFVLIIQQIFLSTLDQLLVNLFSIGSIILILVSLNFLLNRVAFINKNKPLNEIPYLFTLSSLALLILSGASKLFLENTTIDLQMNDTYFVISRLYIVFLMSLVIRIWAMIYYATPKIINRKLNQQLSKIHFWTTFYGVIFSLISMQLKGITSVPRRYYSFDNFDSFDNFRLLNSSITIFALIILSSQLVYFVNLFYSLVKGQKVKY